MTNPPPPAPPVTQKRPPRKLLRTLAIVLCLLLSPIVAFVIWSEVEAGRVNRTLDALEARREPLDVDAFDSRPATDEQRRASHYYAQAGKLVGSEVFGPRLRAAGKTIEELCTLPPGDAGRAQRVAALRDFEASYAEAMDLLDRAAALDAAGWDDADRPERQSYALSPPRSAGIVNVARIARLACSGDGEAAAAALLATLRVRRVLSPPFFGALPIRTVHSLQSLLTFTAPSEAILERLQKEYASAAGEDAVEKRLLAIRAQWLSWVLPGEFSDPPPGYFDRRISPVEAVVTALARPARDRMNRADLAEFEEAIEAARRPWPAKLEAAAAWSRKYRTSRAASPQRRGFFAVLIRPFGSLRDALNLEVTVANAAEALAVARASVGALAVARYRHAHDGALPGSLNDLVPAYLTGPLIDPYTGSELIYRKDGGTYKVYSAGANRQDDGGVWPLLSDLQYSRSGNPKDVGIAAGAWPPTGP
jgi:hypothetical protein